MSRNYIRDNVFSEFVSYLRFLGVSLNTIRNYSSDIRSFESWICTKVTTAGVKAQSLKDCLPFLSSDIAIEFKAYLGQRHQKLAVNRRLASLRALSRFLIETAIIETDFMEGVDNPGSQTDLLEKHPVIADFRKHLESEKVSPNTIKNYLSAIKHFLSWLDANH